MIHQQEQSGRVTRLEVTLHTTAPPLHLQDKVPLDQEEQHPEPAHDAHIRPGERTTQQRPFL
jgi:hypothetical protein